MSFGPPIVAQQNALEDLLRGCELFEAEEEARTPTDLNTELSTKLQAYWGEPVYTAQDLTPLQILPTLPEKKRLLPAFGLHTYLIAK